MSDYIGVHAYTWGQGPLAIQIVQMHIDPRPSQNIYEYAHTHVQITNL